MPGGLLLGTAIAGGRDSTWHSSCSASVMCAGVSVCSFIARTASPTSAAVLPGDSCRTRRNASRARGKSPSWNRQAPMPSLTCQWRRRLFWVSSTALGHCPASGEGQPECHVSQADEI